MRALRYKHRRTNHRDNEPMLSRRGTRGALLKKLECWIADRL